MSAPENDQTDDRLDPIAELTAVTLDLTYRALARPVLADEQRMMQQIRDAEHYQIARDYK